MRDTTTPVSDDVAAGMKRRTILAGAAWSVPVIAVATASPAFAATSTCPHVSSYSDWTRGNNGYTDSGYFIDRDGRKTYVVSDNNNSGKNSGLVARAWMEATVQVTAGQTLNLSYEAFGNYSSYTKAGSAPAVAVWSVDGSAITENYGTQTDRYGNIQLPIKESADSSNPWKSYSASYKANETKSVTIRWEVSLYPQGSSDSGNDDISVTLPTISCSS